MTDEHIIIGLLKEEVEAFGFNESFMGWWNFYISDGPKLGFSIYRRGGFKLENSGVTLYCERYISKDGITLTLPDNGWFDLCKPDIIKEISWFFHTYSVAVR